MEHLLGKVPREVVVRGLWRSWTARLGLWRQRRHERLLLEALLRETNAHLLRDLGIEPERALAELRKPFWRG